MLEVSGLSVSYGQHRALEQVAVKVGPGEIVVILGANGAGKSTLLNAIAGIVRSPAAGHVRMDQRSLTGLPVHQIVEAGIALVPEGRRLFGDLTVLENLQVGAYARRARAHERANLEQVFSLFPRLAERQGQTARTLSGGEQQMVAIGKALMSAPAILMLDEPSLGLSPLLCSELFRTLAEIRKSGVGILLVEQNAKQALAIADRGYLLETGRIVGEDTAANLARNTAVQEAYLGGRGEAPSMPAAAAPGAAGVAPGPSAAHAAPPPTAAAQSSAQSAAQSSAQSAVQSALESLARQRGHGGHRSPGGPGHAPPGAADLDDAAIAALVQHAAHRQATEVEAVRTSGARARHGLSSGMDGMGSMGADTSLADALARIEAAARDARRPRTQPALPGDGPSPAHPRPDTAPGAAPNAPGTADPLPVIEVYRRPKLEIYRRSPDGSRLLPVQGD